MKFIELFSGHGTISKAFLEAGHEVFSVDIRRRKGICEPSLKKDVLDLTVRDFPFLPDVLWASPPYDIWSYAAGSKHFKNGEPQTEKCILHIRLLKKMLDLIDAMAPKLYFIENPRGKMRKYPELNAWLENHGGVTKTLTLSSYGFLTTKPTNIFTNAISWQPRPLASYGRGAKCQVVLDNLTKCSRQATPLELAQELVIYCEGEEWLWPKLSSCHAEPKASPPSPRS